MPLPCVAGSARVARGPAGLPFAAQRRAEPPRSEQRACAAASPGGAGLPERCCGTRPAASAGGSVPSAARAPESNERGSRQLITDPSTIYLQL